MATRSSPPKAAPTRILPSITTSRPTPTRQSRLGQTTLPSRSAKPAETEYEEIWSRQKRTYPQFAEYERKTARDRIPVLVLEPR